MFNDSIERLLRISYIPTQSDDSNFQEPAFSQEQALSQSDDFEAASLTPYYDIDYLLEQINLDKRRAVTDLNL